MKVILLEDIRSLGKKGEIVEVSDGYARNVILKKKQGVEKEGEIAVHNQRHAKSDPIGRGLYCPASPDRFSQKGIIRFQIGWGTCVLAYFRD